MKHKIFVFISAVLVLSLLSFTTSTAAARQPASVQGAVFAQTNITYVVQSGDTLNKIGAKYCTTWYAIYNLNKAVIGPNPNIIYPGTVLTVPANCSPGTPPPTNPTPTPTPTAPPSGVVDHGPITHAAGTFSNPYYTVAPGDWLSYIGKRFAIPWQNISAANHLSSTVIYAGQKLLIPGTSGATPPPPTPTGGAERVNFASGTISAARTGTISNGVPKTYVLGAAAGQTMYVYGVSRGEALTVSIKNASGQALTLSGTNGAVNFSVQASLPAAGDYFVTFTPVTQPESATLNFDVTFKIP